MGGYDVGNGKIELRKSDRQRRGSKVDIKDEQRKDALKFERDSGDYDGRLGYYGMPPYR
jgi:hypothetical protein